MIKIKMFVANAKIFEQLSIMVKFHIDNTIFVKILFMFKRQ